MDAPTFPAPRRVARHDNLPIEETKLLHWEKRPEYHPNDRPHQRGDKHWCNDNDGGVDRESRTGEGASSGDHLSVVPALFQTIIIIINNFIKISEVLSHTITWRYICTKTHLSKRALRRPRFIAWAFPVERTFSEVDLRRDTQDIWFVANSHGRQELVASSTNWTTMVRTIAAAAASAPSSATPPKRNKVLWLGNKATHLNHHQSVKRVRFYALFNSLYYMTEYFTNFMTLYLFNCTSRNRKTKVRTFYGYKSN